MLNPITWLKRQPKPDAQSKIEQKPKQPIKTELSRAEINEFRKSEFNNLGIPYELVLEAEKNGIVKIDPSKIASDTVSNNSKLATLGLPIKLSYLECFTCQLLYFDYLRFKDFQQKVKNLVLPERSLIDIIILAESEKIIRQKYQLDHNPETGDLAKEFQTEVKDLFEKFCQQSIDYQLKQRAERLIRRQKKLSLSESLPDS